MDIAPHLWRFSRTIARPGPIEGGRQNAVYLS